MCGGAAPAPGSAAPRTAREATELRWRVRVDPPASGARNMALDHALALAIDAAPGGDAALLRLYAWSSATISFGRNEPALGRYDEARARREGVDFVRRPSGGRAVLHDRELTYAVAVPVDALGGLRPAYRQINEALARGLRALGLPATLAAPGGAALPPDAGPCFREPAAGEVVADHVKVAGSAQFRVGRTLLQHGALPLAGSQALLEALRLPGAGAAQGGTAPSPAARERSNADGRALSALLARPVSWSEAAAGIRVGFREHFGGLWDAEDEEEPPRVLAKRLLVHYQSPGWTWRM